MPQEPVIRLIGVRKEYADGELTVTALQSTDLVITRGEFICIAGPSGSGKTTLLNLLGCIDEPSAGKICLIGRMVGTLRRREAALLRRACIGFVFQSFNLIPVLTAFENVEYVLLLKGVPARERLQLVRDVLDRVGLAGLGAKKPRELSGGQQQRVAVARAIVGGPAIVLADEPTANLDSTSGEKLMSLLREINRQRGTTFVFSSHDPRVINSADRIIRLTDGQVVSDSCPASSSFTFFPPLQHSFSPE